MISGRKALWATTALVGMIGAAAQAQMSTSTFEEQVSAGRDAYAANCAICHGETLAGGQFAGALKGPVFLSSWGDVPAAALRDYITSSMPPGGSSRLETADFDSLTALILHENGGRTEDALSGDMAISMPPAPTIEEQNALGIGGISPLVAAPSWPEPVDRFANFTPVTQDMLSNPAPENWMSWRRGHNGHGFSPLDQINRDNVGDLTIAWAQALPVGPNMAEPLIRDGVLYAHGFGDEVFAFDATDGRPLCLYQRQLPDGIDPLSKKSIALWGNLVITATSDLNLLALDARTGRPVWDVSMMDGSPPAHRANGGPIVADGVAMMGITTTEAGGGLIVAVDVETGEQLWTFDTVAKTGQLGGDTWNEIPDEERRGGSVWTSGTYDEETGLALWGVAQSYDTGPLRDLVEGSNNDALFTNSTLAFEPRTGELVWYFQHMHNDQYDLDWVFERTIGTVTVDGEERRVVITGGKEGLFDAVDAATGEYLSTVDMGFQDFIIDIDPETGRKTPDPALLPGRDRPGVFMCPHAGGGRNWSPTVFEQETSRLFVNARDTCMEMRPSEGGFLTSGVDIFYSFPRDSDGNFGFVQALNMETGEVLWEARRRAPYNMGMLGTAGGLLFSGGMDRQFIAFDMDTGEELWTTGLTGVPNASPVTYSVDGKQYIAIVTGMGNPLAFGLPGYTPEIPLPPVNSSSLYVFALPDQD